MKSLQGEKYKWEPQPIKEGIPMPNTNLSRGSRVTDGTVLGMSDNGEFIGVIFDHRDVVSEYTVEQFSTRFGHIKN